MSKKPRLMIVGAFPPSGSSIVGGIVTDCKLLINSDFSESFHLSLIDSTQISNPPPRLFTRLYFAFIRFIRFIFNIIIFRPQSLLLFTSTGFSVFEKSIMAFIGRLAFSKVFIFPRGGPLIDTAKSTAFNRFIYRFLLTRAHYFLCQGPLWESFALDFLGFSPSHTFIVHNWTATPRLLSIGERRTVSICPHPFRILFVGWLEREKGIYELLAASKLLSGSYPFHLTIAGCGSYEDEAKRFVERNSLNDYVQFVGWANDSLKESLYEDCDLFVLPSWYEGFPNVVVEAMASRLPVISSSVGNIPSLITHMEHAILVPPKDLHALYSSIKLLIDDADLRVRLSQSGYNLARSTFSVESSCSKLTNIIKHSLA